MGSVGRSSSITKTTTRGGLSLGGLLFTAASGWVVYSHFRINHCMPIADAIPAERGLFVSKTAGRLNYYVDRQAEGRPLVLIHSVNAAASSYEMGPLFDQYRGQRPVYALDLPGYGFSERSERIYTPELFSSAIEDFLDSEVKEPADVIALSLGAEFAARVALARPNLIHSLTFISPSGLNNRSGNTKSVVGRFYGIGNLMHMLFSFPVWARPIFDLIATHSSIEFFLGKSFVGPIPPGFVAYDFAAAHQPGAEHAPLYFLSGKLFTNQVRKVVYEHLHTPTLVIYDQDPYSNFGALPDLLMKNPAWQAVRLVPSLGLPHFERLADTVDVIDNFWKGIK